MGKQVATAVVFKVNGVDLSAYVASVNLSSSTAEVTTTSFGSGGNVERVGGLKDNSVTVSFMQDFVGASVENTIYPLIGGTVACELLPNGTAVGTANRSTPSPRLSPTGRRSTVLWANCSPPT